MIKLIASDMDGTLLNDQGIINKNIFTLISTLQKKNIVFVAASGRSYSQLSNDFENADNALLFIAHNGALIKYNNQGETLYSCPLDQEAINHVLQLKREFGEEILLSGAEIAHIVNPSEELVRIFNSYGLPALVLNSFHQVKVPTYKISYFVTNGVNPAMLEYLKNNLSSNLEFVVSGENWIDIMNKGTSKGAAIKILQEKFNIDKKNTMVFGDYYNDVTMFKTAYYSYAMKNAPEDVKKHANFIADSNNNNGVYNIIYKYASSM
ncbi:MAG: HAD family hydrolase [Clostridiaceae bacterium]|nr:HAD family hydrolase [Clostridiaceae bacterium]